MIPKILTGYAVAGTALVALLTACEPADGSTPSPDPGPAVSDRSARGTELPEGDLFLAAARTVAPTLLDASDSDLIALGQSVCAAFGRGVTSGEVAGAMIGPDTLTGTEAGAVVGAATSSYGLCPEFSEVANGGENTAATL